MSDPHSQAELIEQLEILQHDLAGKMRGYSEAQFFNLTTDSWSAADYLKHLLLSIKPVAKGLGLPQGRILSMFGPAERPSMSYTEIVDRYRARLAAGIRAEDYEKVVPVSYRVPEGVTDLHSYLVEQWDDAHQKLISAIHQWSEADLDSHQLPHPALGSVTVRELILFTLHHNRLHAGDIERVAGEAIT
jgi:DinB superfamily